MRRLFGSTHSLCQSSSSGHHTLFLGHLKRALCSLLGSPRRSSQSPRRLFLQPTNGFITCNAPCGGAPPACTRQQFRGCQAGAKVKEPHFRLPPHFHSPYLSYLPIATALSPYSRPLNNGTAPAYNETRPAFNGTLPAHNHTLPAFNSTAPLRNETSAAGKQSGGKRGGGRALLCVRVCSVL